MRADIVGCRRSDDEVKATIRRVYEERGYLLDPHSAIAYMGMKQHLARSGGSTDRIGMFLATAHPAKFSEVVEPVLGRPIETPPALAEMVARPRHVLKIHATSKPSAARWSLKEQASRFGVRASGFRDGLNFEVVASDF